MKMEAGARFQLRRSMRVPLSLITVGVGLMIALLGLGVSRTWAQQAEFISIDCGASQAYVDPVTNISWVPDDGYIATGKNWKNVMGSNDTTLQTLRYFPESRGKDCYILQPVQADNTYLIRATFSYGSYDGLPPPTFYLDIEASRRSTLTFNKSGDWVELETIILATNNSIFVCLSRISPSETPFISSLELRPIFAMNSSYLFEGTSPGSVYLYGHGRVDLGADANTVVRYPDDLYDRKWRGSGRTGSNYEFLSTSHVVNVADLLQNPPTTVMQTAITCSRDKSFNFSFPDSNYQANSFYNILFYFAEIQQLSSNESRYFDFCTHILTNDALYGTCINAYTVSDSVEAINNSHIIISPNKPMNDQSYFSFVPDSNSTLGPILNAAEIYEISQSVSPRTYYADENVIDIVKIAFNLTDWTGDPCSPTPYDWIACTSDTPPRVYTLKVSNMNLTGSIPLEIGKLSALNALWLDNNTISGSIPEQLSELTNLQQLRLENNKLTGSIPEQLSQLTNLQQLFLQNNNLSGDIPQALINKSNLKLETFGNLLLCTTSQPCPALRPASPGKKSHLGIIIGCVIAGAIVVAGAVTGLIYWRCCCVGQHSSPKRENKLPGTEGDASCLRQKRAHEFSFHQVKIATDNFRRKIGKGGFGPVFYGKLPHGQEVAVKKLDVKSQQGMKEFFNEVDLLSRARHKNLVSLIGYCQENSQRMLIYEYLPMGDLRKHLYGTGPEMHIASDQPALDWKTRLNIAFNAAQGLEYLHTGCSPNIIHRDVKSNNILLTNKMVAKVADFGLSKLAEEGVSHVSTFVKGTLGYLDPEYFSTLKLTGKSDVYSFGVVLLEIISGRPPINYRAVDSKVILVDWVRPHLQSGQLQEIVDPKLGQNFNVTGMRKVVELALNSLEPIGLRRPTMREVVQGLGDAMALEYLGDPSPEMSATSSSLSDPHPTAVGNGELSSLQSSAEFSQSSVEITSYAPDDIHEILSNPSARRGSSRELPRYSQPLLTSRHTGQSHNRSSSLISPTLHYRREGRVGVAHSVKSTVRRDGALPNKDFVTCPSRV